MLNRKYIEQNHSLYLLFMMGAIVVIMFNYLAVIFGIEVFIFEHLTLKVYEYSTKLYLYAKITILITTGLLFLEYNSKKSFEIESNKKGLLFAGLLLIAAICFIVIYLLSTNMPVNLFKLTVEMGSFLIFMISLHLFIRIVNSLEYEDNTPITDILKPNGAIGKSDYYIETVEPIKTKIPIPNMFMSSLIIGGAGAGKTASLNKPRIAQCIEAKTHSMFCYDPKFPELTNMVTAQLEKENRLDKLRVIDFLYPQHKINPIHPMYLKDDEVITELAEVLADNLGLSDNGGNTFWRNNFVMYVNAVILFLKYNHPALCTLPHVISIMLDERITTIVAMCETVPQAVTKISPVKVAIGFKVDKDDENVVGGSQNQTAGVLGTVGTALSKLDSQKIFYTLNGNDFNLKLNEAEKQLYVTVGNHSEFHKSFKAPLALIFSTMIRLNNVDAKPNENRIPLFIPMDEFNTVWVPDIEKLPSTGRSRKMMLSIATQDYSLIQRDYGKDRTEVLIASCGNIFIGNNGNEKTLRMAADMIGKRDAIKRTKSKSNSDSVYNNSQNIGLSKSEQEKLVIQPYEIAEFQPGEFIAKIASSKQTFSRFRTKYIEYEEKQYPEFYKGKYDKKCAMWMNYLLVKAQADQLISDYEIKLKLEGKINDPKKKPAKNSTLQKEKRNENAFNY